MRIKPITIQIDIPKKEKISKKYIVACIVVLSIIF